MRIDGKIIKPKTYLMKSTRNAFNSNKNCWILKSGGKSIWTYWEFDFLHRTSKRPEERRAKRPLRAAMRMNGRHRPDRKSAQVKSSAPHQQPAFPQQHLLGRGQLDSGKARDIWAPHVILKIEHVSQTFPSLWPTTWINKLGMGKIHSGLMIWR